MAEPTPADYLVHYYKQKLAAAQDEAAVLFSQVQAERKRADTAEEQLKTE